MTTQQKWLFKNMLCFGELFLLTLKQLKVPDRFPMKKDLTYIILNDDKNII